MKVKSASVSKARGIAITRFIDASARMQGDKADRPGFACPYQEHSEIPAHH